MGTVIVKAYTLLLMCGSSLACAAAADPIGASRHGPDGWIFGPPAEGYSMRHRAPQRQQDSVVVPLPRPRPYGPDTTGATQAQALSPAMPAPSTGPMPQPSPIAAPPQAAAPAPQPAPTPQPIPMSQSPLTPQISEPAPSAPPGYQPGALTPQISQPPPLGPPGYQPGPLVAPGPHNAAMPQPSLTPLGSSEQGAAPKPQPKSEPINDKGSALMPPVAPLD
jgi:hypothetical protein